ncbi:MAG: hypothetical protein ACJ8FY_14320 [Gemmataceae bacterium]
MRPRFLIHILSGIGILASAGLQAQPVIQEEVEASGHRMRFMPSDLPWFSNESPKSPFFEGPVLSPWINVNSLNQPLQFSERSPWSPWDDTQVFREWLEDRVKGVKPGNPEESNHDKALRVPLAGSVFLFGQARKADEMADSQATKFTGGQTGVGWGIPIQNNAELLFRCGPQVTANDAARSGPSQDRSALPFSAQYLRLDVEGRWLLMGQLTLEWQGAITPAFNSFERDMIQHDLRLVFPLGQTGQLQMGTKHYWENKADSKTWEEGGQLYGGFRLKW